jgi:hypothetical protein
MQLYDAYPGQDVVIIAVHDSTLSTMAKLLEKTAQSKQQQWGDRDLPFRIALAGAATVTEGEKQPTANGQVIADYGIREFPTTLLIDQQGKLVARLDPHDVETTKKRINELLGR